jgi:uncharacterized protein (DUF58 family)
VKLLRSIYFHSRFFIIGLLVMSLFLIAVFVPQAETIAFFALGIYGGLIITDLAMLFSSRKGVEAERIMAARFSNGDENPVRIRLKNHYKHKINLRVIDELPPQFQIRDFNYMVKNLAPGQGKEFSYKLRPVSRGVYRFGRINVFVKSRLGLLERRFFLPAETDVAVYPSFHRLKDIELLSFAEMRNLLGLKKIRHIGYNKEFEQVKDYVIGDEIKHINWKATARKNQLMVNQFQDEKSQHIYAIIDMGRNMKMPFNGMTLLDYSINAALALSQIILKNTDRAGLITYNRKVHSALAAEKRNNQLQLMLETLYQQKTRFAESSLEQVYSFIKNHVTQRSLLIFFINFESTYSLKRYLPMFIQLHKNHLVLLVSFKNTDLEKVSKAPAQSLEEVYLKTVSEQFLFEKRMFLKELRRYGIQTLYTAPENLTINTINKYLEIKARGML